MALSIQDKNVQRVLAGFVIFIVLTAPQAAGQQTRAFASFLGDALDSIFVFIDSAFSDADQPQ